MANLDRPVLMITQVEVENIATACTGDSKVDGRDLSSELGAGFKDSDNATDRQLGGWFATSLNVGIHEPVPECGRLELVEFKPVFDGDPGERPAVGAAREAACRRQVLTSTRSGWVLTLTSAVCSCVVWCSSW